MNPNDPEIRLSLALENIGYMKSQLEDIEQEVKDGLKGLQERKPKRKRSKKDGS